MRNFLNYGLSILVLMTFTGCLTGNRPAELSSGKIINGVFIPENESTNFNVFISMFTSKCTGSVISPRFILTAAHCLKNIKLSTLKLANGSVIQPNRPANFPTPKAFHIHPAFDGKNNDVALIELTSPVAQRVKPVALFDGSISNDAGFSVESYGYSYYTTSSTIDLLGFFKQEPSQVFPTNNDKGIVRLHGKILSATTNENSIMLMQINGGVCSGDSGGPLIIDIKGQKVQIGINRSVLTINNKANCDSIGWVTPVMPYLDWINEKLMASQDSPVKRHRYARAEMINEMATGDQFCARIQANVFIVLSKKAEALKKNTCDTSLITSMEQALHEAQKSCLSEMAKNYPEILKKTIKRLNSFCAK